ncbi:ABC transporter substrate-binding protein [Brevibacterium sp. 91QC2O2]|uniref:ABC transporter substrate-binding protein n=1 Tax=Brevibacterium sp. 91QC2O2 TaxID=2968458 RepID=UPI00211C86D0|nr:ABC transporter substrate-binding protein [Brevibacterium sp. 91QC2O2]MCQ9366657.1 ABC transporter substrate-binding protein [Brevibacterium sp. 91QC2O2]
MKGMKTLAAAACATALAFTLSACGARPLSELYEQKAGGAVEVKVPADEKAKGVLDAVQADPQLTELVPEDIRATGIKMANSVGYPPMELFADNGKDILGVDPAIAAAIAKKLGIGFHVEDQEFASMIPGMKSGRYNFVMSSMTDNKERRAQAFMVDYVKAGNAIQVSKGNPKGIKGPQDLCGQPVSTVQGGSSEARLKTFSKDCESKGKPAIKILGFSADGEAGLAIKSGRSVASLTDYPPAADRAADPESGFDAVEVSGGESIWGIAIDNKNKPFAEAVQKALQSLIDDGSYGKILDAWSVDKLAIDKATINGGD